MEWAVYGALILSVIVNLCQYHRLRLIRSNLAEIETGLTDIVEQKTGRRVFLHTDLKRIQRFLIQINRLLDYSQKVKADYEKSKMSLQKMLSNVSHDLKTPLTVILGYTEALRHNRLADDAERAEMITRLHDKTVAVIEMINRFFDLAKLDAGDYDLPLEVVRINEICRQSMLDHYELLISKGIKVHADIPEKPIFIMGNEEALHRILSNLISNAIRYGSEGNEIGITLRGGEQEISIEVWDRGRGIPEIEQDRVFERLYTLDDARNPIFQGSGLGLSITKRLVEAMKGTIALKSAPHDHTVFSCTFKSIT